MVPRQADALQSSIASIAWILTDRAMTVVQDELVCHVIYTGKRTLKLLRIQLWTGTGSSVEVGIRRVAQENSCGCCHGCWRGLHHMTQDSRTVPWKHFPWVRACKQASFQTATDTRQAVPEGFQRPATVASARRGLVPSEGLVRSLHRWKQPAEQLCSPSSFAAVVVQKRLEAERPQTETVDQLRVLVAPCAAVLR